MYRVILLLLINIVCGQSIHYTSFSDQARAIAITLPAGKYRLGLQYTFLHQSFPDNYLKIDNRFPLSGFKRQQANSLSLALMGEPNKSIFHNFYTRGFLFLGLNYVRARVYSDTLFKLYTQRTIWQSDFGGGLYFIFYNTISLGIQASIRHQLGLSAGIIF